MDDSILLGLWRTTLPVPPLIWQKQVQGNARLDFMSVDHHRVRDFAVRELPRLAKPLLPELIARELDIPLTRVTGILDDLEKNMTFIYRDGQGAITWAYPVTVTLTPHRVTFSSGEEIRAA
jgi:hypothetical protein